MKRILLFLCAVALSCALIVIPCFASEAYVGTWPGGYYSENVLTFDNGVPPAGDYVVTCTAVIEDVYGEVFSLPITIDEYVQSDEVSYECYVSKSVVSSDDFGDFSFMFSYAPGVQDCCSVMLNDEPFDVSLGDLTFTFVPVAASVTVSPSVGIFDVFSFIGSWIISALGVLTGIFWTGQSLTFLGVLAVAALGIAVVFLVIALIRRFLAFRG